MIGVALTTVCGAGSSVLAQSLKDVQTSDTPLVLKAQGSFFVGGEKVEQTQGELGDLGPGGHITVNQMYVRYMVPQGGDGNPPVVMVHGATLTGKSWETTPDGRMGWDEYFVRKGHPVYVPDQVGRGRSGFNQAVFNNARAGSTPANTLPRWLRFSDEGVWPNFRIGPAPGQPYPDTQFPVDGPGRTLEAGCAGRQLWWHPHAQPDAQGIVGSRRPGEWSRADGALAVRLVSTGGRPAQSRRDERPRPRRAWHVPGQLHRRTDCHAGEVPLLVVFGDHRDTPTGIPTLPTWQTRYEACQALIGSLKAAGGQAQMISPAEIGTRGNSHMIMQDKNHLQVADLILKWIDERVSKRTGVKK